MTERLITGQGKKERIVFVDDASRAALRTYLEARADRHAPLLLRHDDVRRKPGPAGSAGGSRSNRSEGW